MLASRLSQCYKYLLHIPKSTSAPALPLQTLLEDACLFSLFPLPSVLTRLCLCLVILPSLTDSPGQEQSAGHVQSTSFSLCSTCKLWRQSWKLGLL